jgi:putative hydrolase of the HAD superfamily
VAPGLADADAIFFDVDDTLYDFDRSMALAFAHLHATFRDVFARHTLDALAEAYWSHYHGMGEHAKRELINRDPDLFRRTMWAGALANLGLDTAGLRSGLSAPGGADPHDLLVERITTEFDRTRAQQWRAAIYPGARELLADLRKARTLGVITNGPTKVQRPKLEAIGYREFFEEPRVFVSGEFGAAKPDPSIFLAAARSAGVAPERCVMVGDARVFDMPAKAVGFRTILFCEGRDVPDTAADEHPPDAVAKSYRDVRRLLGF